MYLDHNNDIIEINNKGIGVFIKDRPFKNINPELALSLREFFKIGIYKQGKKVFNIDDMVALDLDMNKLTTYCSLLLGAPYTLNLESGETQRFKVKASIFQLFSTVDPAVLLELDYN